MRWLSMLILLSLCVPFVLVQPSFAAIPKQGVACTKLNLKATSGKYIFTCIKVGKKLAWSKGSLIPTKSNKSMVATPLPTKKPAHMTMCYTLGAKLHSDQGIGLSCEKMQDGLLFWIDQRTLMTPMPAKTATPQPNVTPSSAPVQPVSKPSLLTACNQIDEKSISDQGITLVCKKMSDGMLMWEDDARLAKLGDGIFKPISYETNDALSQMFSMHQCEGTSTTLTSGITDVSKINYIYPMGGMIGTHITPIDHIYVYYPFDQNDQSTAPAGSYLIQSPADGHIVAVDDFRIGNGYPYPDYRITIEHSCNLYSVFIHVGQLTGPAKEIATQIRTDGHWFGRIPVKAGEVISDDSLQAGFDYSLFDQTKQLKGLANLQSYIGHEAWKPFTVDLLDYLPASSKSAYQSKYLRSSAPIGGKIDWDQPGTALGNWYVKDTNGYRGVGSNAASYNNHGKIAHGYWDTHLAIAPDAVDASTYIFSVGDWEGCACQFVTNDPTLDPSKITAASGLVVVELSEWDQYDANGNRVDRIRPSKDYKVKATNVITGLLAIQVNHDGSLTVEKAPTLKSKSEFKGFTAAAQTYVH